MSNICKTVTLRTRKIKKDTMLSYYLDYYPGYRDSDTMKVLKHESLGIYIYAHPRNKREQDYNDSLTEKAKAICCRRYESIVNERYDFFDKDKLNGDFLAYFKKKADKRDDNRYEQILMHFTNFCEGKCTFGEINVELCNRFREYLLDTESNKSTKEHKTLHQNTASLYWSGFRGLLHTAYKEHKIKENPNGFLEKIETIPTEKEHLAQTELVKLVNTECSEPELKKAFLFACLTGLRKSDIKALTWDKIQPYGDGELHIKVRMIKTGQWVDNPISKEALELIGYYDKDDKDGKDEKNNNGRKPTDKVFPGFNDSMTNKPLKNWLEAAGITKHITFHCTRHTFGSLQVEAGTGIYTVQNMLGHKNVTTTAIYAAMSDSNKRDTIDRITLKPQPQMRVVKSAN